MSFIVRDSCGVPVVFCLVCSREGWGWAGGRRTVCHRVDTLEDVALVGGPGVVVGRGLEHFANAMFGEVLVMG